MCLLCCITLYSQSECCVGGAVQLTLAGARDAPALLDPAAAEHFNLTSLCCSVSNFLFLLKFELIVQFDPFAKKLHQSKHYLIFLSSKFRDALLITGSEVLKG